MWNAGLDEAQAGIKIAGRNKQPQICRWYHSNGRKWWGTKELLDEGERRKWKGWLKTFKNKIMAFWPITSWQIEGKKKQWQISLGSKVTADSDYNLEIKRHLLLGRKARQCIKDKPRQCIKKQRYYFAHKVLYRQSYGFSSCHVWMSKMDHKEGWVSKNWCFLRVVLEKTLESLGQHGDQTSQS